MSDLQSTAAHRIAALARLESGELPIDAESMAGIVASLAAESKEERRRAAGALSQAARHGALISRVEAILDDEDAARRWGAAFALARSGVESDAVFDGALEALGFDDGDVRWAALEIAVGLARGGVRGTARIDRIERMVALARNATAAGRKMALYGLRDLAAGDEAVYTLALFSGDAGVRLAAISGIGRLARTTTQAHDALLVTVERDADAGVRRAAAVILGKVAGDDPRVRAALEGIRATSTDADLVRAAERGLSKR